MQVTQQFDTGRDSAAFIATGEANARPARIIVDFTDLIGHLAQGGAVSGIPRVVFEFANAAPALARDQGIDLQFGFFDQSYGKYLRLSPPAEAATSGRMLEWLLSDPIFRRGYPRPIDLSKLRRKYEDRPFRQGLHVTYAKCRLARRRFARVFQTLRGDAGISELPFRSGDVLLMLGSGWSAAPCLDHIEPLQAAGIVTPVILIHDLIPLLHLDNDASIPAAIFEPWLERVAKMGCRFLTVSEATKSDLLNYLADKRSDTRPIRVTRLPHEFSTPAPKSLEPDVQSVLAKNYAMFVGPVSGRKNAKRLLEAWAKVLPLVGPENMPCLVITSGRGAEEVYESHIRPIETHVRLLSRPDDFALSELYRRAAFTIFPSLHEGWGLPVGESLWHGTPCITSDRSSMPEVGGELCDYVNPESVDSIADAVQRLALDRTYRDARAATIRRARLRTWADFAKHILQVSANQTPCCAVKQVAKQHAIK